MAVSLDATNDTPVFTTERLELSFGKPQDADVLFPYVHGEPGRLVTDTLVWNGPVDREDAVRFFELHALGTFGENGFHWLLRDRTGEITGTVGEAMGSIGVRPTDDQEVCDIGYWLGAPFWGKGIMAEAIAAIASHCFDHLGFTVVAADVFSTNARSARLLERLGFEQAGEMPAYNIKRGCPVDGLHYVLRADTSDIN